MISYQCPHCGMNLQIPDEYAGQTGKCKGCGSAITVPKPMTEEPPRPTPQPPSQAQPAPAQPKTGIVWTPGKVVLVVFLCALVLPAGCMGGCALLVGIGSALPDPPSKRTASVPVTEEPAPDPLELERQKADFETVVGMSFSGAITRSVDFADGILTVELFKPDDERFSNYFESGDKVNKIYANEIARFFYKLPDVSQLRLSIDLGTEALMADLSRHDIESYYGLHLNELREYDDDGNLIVGEKWRNHFLPKCATKEQRKNFADRFVRLRRTGDIHEVMP